jgi:hypothetical protein
LAASGNTWAFLQWVLGFREAGWQVWMVESLSSAKCVNEQWQPSPFEHSANKKHWERVVQRFGLEACSTLWVDGAAAEGEAARSFAAEADLFLNVSGHFKLNQLELPQACKLYLDLDPGFTQIWQETYGSDMNFSGHDVFFSYGTQLGQDGSRAPTCGIEWKGVLPPVVLSYWPVQAAQGVCQEFTTLAHWQGYKWCEWQGQWYTGKSEEFHKFVEVPRSVSAKMELATEVEAHAEELKSFHQAGWSLVSGTEISSSFDRHEAYLRNSSAEFSAAKGGYVLSQGGWFSDRSVCYLASGRPVVLQETGISRTLPVGEGLLVFRDAAEAVRCCHRVMENFSEQQAAARRLAETYLDSKVVIQSLLNRI